MGKGPDAIKNDTMKILVTGGAGYIGSHACKALAKGGYQPIVFGLPVFHGIESRIFEKHGLKVHAQPFTSANDMLNALVRALTQKRGSFVG